MKRLRLTITACALLFAACGGGGDDDDPADSTATRAAALAEIATIQAGEWTPTPTFSPTTPPGTPTATAAPTATPEPTATNTPTATATEEEASATDVPADLLAHLPTLEDMPAGYAITEEGTRSAAELAADWNNPNAILDALDTWGWDANAYRNFEIPSPGFNDAFERMVAMNSSLSRYGSESQAQDAARAGLDLLRDIEGIDIPAVSVDELGDLTIAAQGEVPTDDGTDTGIIALLYVVDGDLVYTFNGVSYRHNSLPDLIEIAKRTLARAE